MTIAFSYGFCAACFAALAAWLLQGPGRGAGLAAPIAAASAVTALWAGAVAWAAWRGEPAQIGVLEIARSLVWIGVLAAALRDALPTRLRGVASRFVWAAPAVAAAWLPVLGLGPISPREPGGYAAALFLLGSALAGLALVENLFRNSRPDGRWAAKFLCVGLGFVFAYELFLYADALLLRQLNATLLEARGLVDAFAAPLIGLSMVRLGAARGVALSRQAVLHTVAVIGSGVYLLAMAAAGYWLREIGGGWGGLLQIAFFAGSLALLLVILSSGAARSHLRAALNRHLFRHRYDYRKEWMAFAATVVGDDKGASLGQRVLAATADIFDSPGAAAWIHRDDAGAFVLTDRWRFAPADAADLPDDHPLAARLRAAEQAIALRDDAGEAPAWLVRCPEAWLLLPLFPAQGRCVGFILLQKPRASRDLDWEDHELLWTVGRQAAAWFAEREAQRALEEARRLEEFNRRLAFAGHDAKNVAAQLEMILANAESHAGDPEFQADMLETLRASVTRLKRLLLQLRPSGDADIGGSEAGAPPESADLAAALGDVVARNAAAGLSVEANIAHAKLPSFAAEKLANAVELLLRNAADAAGPDATLRLSSHVEDGRLSVTVEDDGPGMDADFIRNELFRPLRSTKSEGYGIGAWQCRELVRELGGRLDVQSVPGRGTTMRIVLPIPAYKQSVESQRAMTKTE